MSLLDSDDNYDFVFKIVLVGDVGVGKTCVVQRFKTGIFIERQGNTIGVDFTMKTIDIQGKRVKVSRRVSCVGFVCGAVWSKQVLGGRCAVSLLCCWLFVVAAGFWSGLRTCFLSSV